jgi:hypothetical protein
MLLEELKYAKAVIALRRDRQDRLEPTAVLSLKEEA